MEHIELFDQEGHRWVADLPTRRRERMRGLLGRLGLHEDRALLLPRTRSVHTFGMRFPIEVAWLDDEWRVVAVRPVPPGRVALPRRRARHVLEFASGGAPSLGARLRSAPMS
jgi:uncharacterized membrane protein (UPF0127 family)